MHKATIVIGIAAGLMVLGAGLAYQSGDVVHAAFFAIAAAVILSVFPVSRITNRGSPTR